MRHRPRFKAVFLTLAATAGIESCLLPNESGMKDPPLTVADLHIMRSDGSGERTLDSRTLGEALLTDSLILYVKSSYRLFAAKYTDSAAVQLYPQIPWFDLAISKDRRKVLLTSFPSENEELYTMNGDATDLAKLGTPMGAYYMAHISPALDEIVFARPTGLCTISPDGSNFSLIRGSTDTAQPLRPLYIDASRILYSEDSTDFKATHIGTTSIRVFDKTSRVDRSVVDHTVICYFAQNVIRGDTLLCIEGCNVRILDLRTQSLTTLGPGCWASFSPDGSKIISVDQRNLYIQNIDGGDRQLIYTVPGAQQWIASAELSPDNTFIVFQLAYSVPSE